MFHGSPKDRDINYNSKSQEIIHNKDKFKLELTYVMLWIELFPTKFIHWIYNSQYDYIWRQDI